MKRPVSLTLRLTLLFGAAATVVFLAFGWIIGRSLERHFEEEDIKELKVVGQTVAELLTMLRSNPDLTLLKQRFDDVLVGHHGALLHVSGSDNINLYSSSGLDLSRVPLPTANQLSQGVMQQWNDGKHSYRVFIQKVNGGPGAIHTPYTVIIAVSTDFHLHFLTSFRRILWLMVLCAITVMGILGWIAVRHGHRPLHRMVNQISGISASELSIRLTPETVPAELSELAVSFNDLLQRLEEAFNRLSNFSADIAHELRTPVTNLMTQTQVALSLARSNEEYREILYSNMEEYERMAQMIGDMLFLAQADNGRMLHNAESVNLASEVRKLFDYYEAWAEERGVGLTLEGEAGVQGDRLMLRRALSNLLSNAIRHTPSGSVVSVLLNQTDRGVLVIVRNPGLAIPVEHLPKLFDRFYRVDPSRQRSGEGAGLGLAIVKSITEAHGGNVVATSDKQCTQFSITLPISV